MVPHLLDLTGHFFPKPHRFQYLKRLAIPKKFLLEIESWPDLQGEDAVVVVALQAVVLMRLKFVY